MPWCDDCSKFWNPPSMGPEGECPGCGRVLTAPRRTGLWRGASGAPWHFKLMLVAVAGYLVYRIYWLAEWLPKHVHV